MVKRLFADADDGLSVGKIYNEVEENFPISDYQKEITRYHEPRFHHEIRAIINQLMQNGEIIRVERGKIQKTLKSTGYPHLPSVCLNCI